MSTLWWATGQASLKELLWVTPSHTWSEDPWPPAMASHPPPNISSEVSPFQTGTLPQFILPFAWGHSHLSMALSKPLLAEKQQTTPDGEMTNYSNKLFKGKKKKDISEFVFCGQLEKKNKSPKYQHLSKEASCQDHDDWCWECEFSVERMWHIT